MKKLYTVYNECEVGDAGFVSGFFINNTECMKFLERDLEEIIFNTPNSTLQSIGLDINGTKKRQLRIGNYGISDIVTLHKEYDLKLKYSETTGKLTEVANPIINLTVYELKKENISLSAFAQSVKYLKGIKTYLEDYRGFYDVKFRSVVIGKNIPEDSSIIYAGDIFENIDIYQYSLNINGLVFEKLELLNIKNTGYGSR